MDKQAKREVIDYLRRLADDIENEKITVLKLSSEREVITGNYDDLGWLTPRPTGVFTDTIQWRRETIEMPQDTP